MVLFYAANFGPSLTAILVMLWEKRLKGMRHWFSHCLSRNFRWEFLASVFLLPLGVVALATLINLGIGGKVIQSPASGHVPLVLLNFVLIFLIGGPLAEEFGWRGYAQPVLQKIYDWRIVSLLLGIVWGIWHIPLFLIAQTAQSSIPFWLFGISTVALSVISGWIFNRSKESLIPVMIFHTAVNASPMFVAKVGVADGLDLRVYGIFVTLMCIVAIGMLLDRRSSILD